MSTISDNTVNASAAEAKMASMRALLRELGRVAVAFSGGVDSTFVLKVAADELGVANVVAITSTSASVAKAEVEDAKQLAGLIGVQHELVETQEFENENYLSNPVNRCYYCKTTLYSLMRDHIGSLGFEHIVNGTNHDDLGDYRPGLKAADEHGVHSPAQKAGLTKAEIRWFSKQYDLPTFDKPAAPCLSSRVPYGQRIDEDKLRMIELGESAIRQEGIRECRVRCHEKLARIEVPVASFETLLNPSVASRIDERFREIGFEQVTVDLRGFRSGSLNEVIAFGQRQGGES